mgnify:FL=1
MNPSSRRSSRSASRSVSQNARGMAASNARVRSRMQSSNNANILAQRANKGGNLKIFSQTKLVDPPQGFHWMQENGKYYLMKGEYKPHRGAVRKAKFYLSSHGS